MQSMTVLAGGAIRTSRLGFGTSRLHHSARAGDRQTLLATAFDSGIIHFDTAPSYGHGLAEYELGRFLKGRRERCIVATKWGVPPNPWIVRLPNNLRRSAIAAHAVSRKVLGRRNGMPNITGNDLKRGIEASLKRLKVDYIDIHLLHEPTLERIPDLEDLVATYLELRTKGLVRSFGVAGAIAGALSVKIAIRQEDSVLQTGESDWPDDLIPDITYGAISSGPQAFSKAPAQPERTAVDRVRQALDRRSSGVVLVSSRSPDHVNRLASILHP